jgi:hypothetical protein
MTLQLDHVTIAGSDLGNLRRLLADVGLPTVYGGVHSNGTTHMALHAFEDGSYIELLSTVRPGTAAESPWWHQEIGEDAGPCGWCIRVSDIAGECARVEALGIAMKGPLSFHRLRPDGVRIEWDLAVLGSGEPGSLLPFMIQDRTPRELRVPPADVQRSTGLTGVAGVIIGVRDLAWSTELFRETYAWHTSETRADPELEATVVQFEETPVALAAPRSPTSWLGSRLARHGELPAAFLLRSSDLQRTPERLRWCRPGTWLNRPAFWFDPDRLGGVRLGIIE